MDDLERFVAGTVTKRGVDPASRKAMIRTLGRFSVEVDGAEVPTAAWGSRHSRQLCKRIVSARGWPVTRDALYDQLWPNESDRRKLGARLSVQLSAVRRVLGGGIIADRETVALDLDVVHTDLESLLTAEDEQLIVDGFAGEFLPDDLYEDWSTSVRDEARLCFVNAATALAARALEAGESTVAINLTHRILEFDYYNERAHRMLVQALKQNEQPGEARRAHGRWKTAMAELGLEAPPSP